jgi:molybdenum cofactor cytidylyltransferase
VGSPGVAGIILAAGQSRRLGQPKQLLTLDGRLLLQHVVDAANASSLDDVILVLGNSADLITRAIQLGRGRIAMNAHFDEGQSTSIHCGIDAIQSHTSQRRIQAALFLLGDQPTVATALIDAIVQQYHRSSRLIVAPRFADGIGNPVLFDRALWPDLLAITGDMGARGILAARREDIDGVRVDHARPVDIDTWEDYDTVRHSR